MMNLLLTAVSVLSMLSQFMGFVAGDYHYINSDYACFRGENTMGSDERGVRTNADLSMVAAFMCRYARDSVSLPAGVTYQQLDAMAGKTLAYAVSTHKAVRRMPCKDGKYWGSTSRKDCQWESSLWALSVAYSAFFQWNALSDSMKADVGRLLKAECNYELERDIPTGYKYDTKAEENGWEAGVLAVTLALYPDDDLAPRWFERMREFVVNTYSHPSDADNKSVITPWYDGKTVADLYKGANLYPDWTLQNHGFFHTSYQNVVIQELGEAVLALKLMKNTRDKGTFLSRGNWTWMLHNCVEVEKNVLNWLTLPDGEQAMPNGNDWSLFLYDQVTSYSTLACMLGDEDALYFERRCIEQIARRQKTTGNGTWLLHPDVGARRMGVQAHRLMMTWLMHHVFPTDGMKETEWSDFAERYSKAKYFPCQRIVRTLTDKYFACFSFSSGKRSYTGYIEPLVKNSIQPACSCSLVVPYRKYNTGNIVGYYDLEGIKTNARLAGEPEIKTNGRYFSINALLAENDSVLLRHFFLRSTPRGLEYSDDVKMTGKRGSDSIKIKADRTGMLAVSDDVFAGQNHKFIYENGKTVIDDVLTVETNADACAVLKNKSTDNSVTNQKLYPFLKSAKMKHKVLYKVK